MDIMYVTGWLLKNMVHVSCAADGIFLQIAWKESSGRLYRRGMFTGVINGVFLSFITSCVHCISSGKASMRKW